MHIEYAEFLLDIMILYSMVNQHKQRHGEHWDVTMAPEKPDRQQLYFESRARTDFLCEQPTLPDKPYHYQSKPPDLTYPHPTTAPPPPSNLKPNSTARSDRFSSGTPCVTLWNSLCSIPVTWVITHNY